MQFSLNWKLRVHYWLFQQNRQNPVCLAEKENICFRFIHLFMHQHKRISVVMIDFTVKIYLICSAIIMKLQYTLGQKKKKIYNIHISICNLSEAKYSYGYIDRTYEYIGSAVHLYTQKHTELNNFLPSHDETNLPAPP